MFIEPYVLFLALGSLAGAALYYSHLADKRLRLVLETKTLLQDLQTHITNTQQHVAEAQRVARAQTAHATTLAQINTDITEAYIRVLQTHPHYHPDMDATITRMRETLTKTQALTPRPTDPPSHP